MLLEEFAHIDGRDAIINYFHVMIWGANHLLIDNFLKNVLLKEQRTISISFFYTSTLIDTAASLRFLIDTLIYHERKRQLIKTIDIALLFLYVYK